MILARIRSVEQLRGYAPGEFGKLIGLDRIPEARCLRSKMDDLAGEFESLLGNIRKCTFHFTTVRDQRDTPRT